MEERRREKVEVGQITRANNFTENQWQRAWWSDEFWVQIIVMYDWSHEKDATVKKMQLGKKKFYQEKNKSWCAFLVFKYRLEYFVL